LRSCHGSGSGFNDSGLFYFIFRATSTAARARRSALIEEKVQRELELGCFPSLLSGCLFFKE